MQDLYKVVKQLIAPEEARRLSEIIKAEPNKKCDDQVLKSHAYYGLSVCSVLLGRLTDRISKLAGKTLKPTYTYCRVYFKGAVLTPHTDRPSCEYSVTLNLSQSHPWSIFMGDMAVIQNPGDGVIYKGCEIEHSRKEFEGDEYVQVFLHYVDADGPYKDYEYDTVRKHIPNEPIYRLIFESPDPFANQATSYFYKEELSIDDVDKLRTILDTKELSDGLIIENDGVVNTINTSQRRSKVFWIPKTAEFIDIYKRFQRLIGQCNSEFFQFKLTELSELIQYTVYNSNDLGHYDWHIDMGPHKARRKISIVCQLSDPSEYEGGELQFNTGQITIAEKQKGTVILFPSYLLHRVTPVTKGIRRSLVIWVEGPAFI